jgi:hypothetical protein
MANLQVQMSQLVNNLGLSQDTALLRVQTLAELTLAEWSSHARRGLSKTRQAYMNSLQIRNVTPKGFICGLPASPSTSILAHIVEQGMGPSGIGSSGPYDVRMFLLRASTRNIRTSKSGALYLNVPFDHTKESITKMGGARAYRRASRLKPTITTPQGTSWGGRFPKNTVAKLQPHHASDPLAGMVRLVSGYSMRKGKNGPQMVAQTSGYRTWRRASMNGKPWVSKGVTARRYIDKVAQRLPALIQQVYQ